MFLGHIFLFHCNVYGLSACLQLDSILCESVWVYGE